MLNDTFAMKNLQAKLILSNKKSQSYFDFRIEISTDSCSGSYVLPSEYKIAKNITKYSKWQQFNLYCTFKSNFYKAKWAKGDYR